METKVCKCCGKKLNISEFHKSMQHKDRLNSRCKICRSLISQGKSAAEITEEYDRKLFRRLGGLKISILNYAKSGENRFNISSTEGQNFATNNQEHFMKKLSEMIGALNA